LLIDYPGYGKNALCRLFKQYPHDVDHTRRPPRRRPRKGISAVSLILWLGQNRQRRSTDEPRIPLELL
jgi:hypothetical protein